MPWVKVLPSTPSSNKFYSRFSQSSSISYWHFFPDVVSANVCRPVCIFSSTLTFILCLLCWRSCCVISLPRLKWPIGGLGWGGICLLRVERNSRSRMIVFWTMKPSRFSCLGPTLMLVLHCGRIWVYALSQCCPGLPNRWTQDAWYSISDSI